MLLIPCPWCGEREETEFRCGGEAHILRPREPAALSDDQWADYLFMRTNPKGVHCERWRHVHGCGRWFNLARDTVSDQILAVYRMGEPRPKIDRRDGRDRASRGQAGPDAGRRARRRRAMSDVGPGVRTAHRLPEGGRIDRARPLGFTFDGARYEGFAGDTLASALLANGVHLVGRSFKYHRPRGIVAAGAGGAERAGPARPRRRAPSPTCARPRSSSTTGWSPHSQNCWPSLEFDFGAVSDLLSPLLPAGFYYKTFMWPPLLVARRLRARDPRAPPASARRRPSPIPTATSTATSIATCWSSAAGRRGSRRRSRPGAAARG